MITTAQEYFALYHQVTSGNPPDLAVLLPSEENIYHIDLNTRTIEAPQYLGVHKDQNAEVIYFEMDRYYENLDLVNAIGAIEYINADNEGYIYGIPFYDITTLNRDSHVLAMEAYDEQIYQEIKVSEDKILFPWIVGHDVTKTAGTVTFAMSFYMLDKDADQLQAEGENASAKFLLRLNLLPTTSTVLQGIAIDPTVEQLENVDVEVPTLLEMFNMYKELSAEYVMYWDESADEMTQHPNNPVAPYRSRIRTSTGIEED